MSGVELIAEERKRQIEAEGFDAVHDDAHDLGELTEAAGCYVAVAGAVIRGSCAEEWPLSMFNGHADSIVMWPWANDEASWKPSDDAVRNLVKAGALIAAEIDRLERVGR